MDRKPAHGHLRMGGQVDRQTRALASGRAHRQVRRTLALEVVVLRCASGGCPFLALIAGSRTSPLTSPLATVHQTRAIASGLRFTAILAQAARDPALHSSAAGAVQKLMEAFGQMMLLDGLFQVPQVPSSISQLQSLVCCHVCVPACVAVLFSRCPCTTSQAPSEEVQATLWARAWGQAKREGLCRRMRRGRVSARPMRRAAFDEFERTTDVAQGIVAGPDQAFYIIVTEHPLLQSGKRQSLKFVGYSLSCWAGIQGHLEPCLAPCIGSSFQ
jgi:hypothetical protein